MTSQRRLVLNIVSSIVQVLASTLLLFVLYRFLIGVIGVEGLGTWSLVLAICSATQIASLGLPGTVTRLVAEGMAGNDPASLQLPVQTAVLSIAGLATLVVAVAWLLGQQYLRFAMPGREAEALAVLPLALAAFWLSMYASTYQSVLLGLQRFAENNLLLIGDSILQLVLCLLLVPVYGLLGLVIARLACNVAGLVAVLLLARRYLPGLPLVPARWDRRAFRGMVGYAGGLQVIALLVMFSDPVTKGLLGRFGSLAVVGYFEMADKLIKAVRSLLVSANQVLLPRFAVLRATGSGDERALFEASQRVNGYFAVPAFALLILLAPVVSIIWLGRLESTFVLAVQILGVGWLANVLALPSYFASLGTGIIGVNVASHVTLAALNVALGWLLGQWLQATGVMLAWSLALVVSSVVLILAIGRLRGFPVGSVFPASQRLLGAVSVAGIAVAVATGTGPGSAGAAPGAGGLPAATLLAIAVVGILILAAAWRNELRGEVIGILRSSMQSTGRQAT